MFEQAFKNIDDIHRKEAGCTTEATIKSYLIVRTEGARQISRDVLHYSLPAILDVGYRFQSHRGTQFRHWATAF